MIISDIHCIAFHLMWTVEQGSHLLWSGMCDQILGNWSKSYIRQNQTNTTSGQLHYHTSLLGLLKPLKVSLAQGGVEGSNGGVLPWLLEN